MSDEQAHIVRVDAGGSGGSGCLLLLVAAGLLFVLFAAAGGDTTSTTTTSTQTEVLSRNELMSRNSVRIFSPDTYIYNGGDTEQVISGDRNNTGPVQTGGGSCWVSSSQSWGPCPYGAPVGSAVP